MKKEDAGGMGRIFVAALASDIRRGSADTSLPSSSIRPSVSCSSENSNDFGCFVLLEKLHEKRERGKFDRLSQSTA